jgi:hypothetical protein
MPTYAYDIELLKNLFTATFVNTADDADRHVFHIGLDKFDYKDLLEFVNREIVLVGYNNHSYDDAIIRFITTYTKGSDILPELYKISLKLIDDNFRGDKTVLSLRYPKNVLFPWKSIDLMKILGFDKLGISLKQVAINLKWHKILDMPIDFTEYVNLSQLDTILDYNLNDTLITKELYHRITPLRELRRDLSRIYSVNLSSASDSKMANLILENIYQEALKMDIRIIRDMRTTRDKVFLGECIGKFVKFQTPEMRDLLDRVSATVVYNYNRYKYAEAFRFANCTFSLGVGGLHTEDAPGIFVTDNKYIIQDLDVASYYPNLIINNEFYPEHLGVDFITVLKKITAERIAAKKAKDKVKADGLKITINSIFGKLGSETFWLLDAKQMLSTTVTGQMGLLMLVEDLYLKGIEVISCNTDGIVCKIPRDKESDYYEVCKLWEKETDMELEFTQYKKYVRRDVNSYITEKKDGTTKEKGCFLKEVDLKKAYHMPIVAKALHAYYMEGVPVKDTLNNCKDIMEFCISQKTGFGYTVELHTQKGIQELQKTNRFFISKTGGRLIKRTSGSGYKRIGLHVGRLVTILNDFDPAVPFNKYNVDLNFYEKEVMKIVDEIEPRQITMFDLSSMSNGTIKKMDSGSAQSNMGEKLTVRELNKLGVNQFAKKLNEIVKNRETIDSISSRYVYIIGLETKTMMAKVYCFAKGSIQNITIEKAAYKKARIEPGQLIYCNKFNKLERGFSIAEYRITGKLEEEKIELI